MAVKLPPDLQNGGGMKAAAAGIVPERLVGQVVVLESGEENVDWSNTYII